MPGRPAAASLLALALILAPPWMAWAVAPAAVIDGPSTRKSGQSILLSGVKSASDRPLQWRRVGSDGPLLIFDQDGRENVFAFLPDPEPGEYVFALVAIGEVDEGLQADVAIHRVVVGSPAPIPPGPLPVPPTPTPTPPDGSLGLHAYIMAHLPADIDPIELRGGARRLEQAYRETVRLARDGKFSGPQEAIDDARIRVLGARHHSWSEFTLAPKLAELSKAGKLTTLPDIIRAFEEIANALAGVADG